MGLALIWISTFKVEGEAREKVCLSPPSANALEYKRPTESSVTDANTPNEVIDNKIQVDLNLLGTIQVKILMMLIMCKNILNNHAQ